MTDDAQAARIAELEHEVEVLKKQYANAMRDFDAFTYAVSHDLRAPLRSLSGFSQALLEFNEADAGKSRHFLERIQQASRKLSELIDALLSVSRVARAEMHMRDLDFSKLCAEAAAAILPKYPDRSIHVSIAPGLNAFGDARLLRSAVELLLDNACKFTAKHADPKIDIGRNQGGEFYIADNGVGFDPAYADKLFKPFQRLHNDAQFPGVGIGLATVQRIVSRHNGSIRIDGKPESGATVFIDLPPRQGTPNSSSS